MQVVQLLLLLSRTYLYFSLLLEILLLYLCLYLCLYLYLYLYLRYIAYTLESKLQLSQSKNSIYILQNYYYKLEFSYNLKINLYLSFTTYTKLLLFYFYRRKLPTRFLSSTFFILLYILLNSRTLSTYYILLIQYF